uniref:Si:ch211-161h7.8 n=1 Tax=Neogobius melanostomus TaxID=47308 RepID=A0A8C6T2T4_9GOBI
MKSVRGTVQTVALNIVVLTMLLTYALSRSFCKAFAEANSRSCSKLSPLYRAFATAPPTGCGENTDEVVTVQQLKSIMASNNFQLFDVRELTEYQAGHIPGAVNVPLGDLEVSLKLPTETFTQRFGVQAPLKEDDNIVFNCRSGVRSGQALGIARRLGFSKAKHLEGGYSAWENSN